MTAVESGSLRESFIGFKGQEDLGGGLKAFFVLESAIGLDDGTAGNGSSFWGRTSVVGLSGDFGTVALGNARNLMFLANDAFNPFRADSALFSTSSYAFTSGPISAANALLAAGAELLAGNKIAGPALIEEHASTTVLMPGDKLTVDAYGNLVIAVAGAK